MKKILTGISILGISPLITTANAQDYSAQIDTLQNETLKIKQEMKAEKSKAYFLKGKGLSIKSSDGKYKFELKGRIMYDVGGVLDYENTAANGTTSELQEHGFGSEFRRPRFSIKGEVGDGWGFAFQPDFADGNDDTSNRTVGIKDALIYKKIKGFGKLTLGNQKVAAGLYENTSSNNLIFMERPMHNETMNFGHRGRLWL